MSNEVVKAGGKIFRASWIDRRTKIPNIYISVSKSIVTANPCCSNQQSRFIVRRRVYIIKESRFQRVTSLSLLLLYQFIDAYTWLHLLKNSHVTHGHSSYVFSTSSVPDLFSTCYLTLYRKKPRYCNLFLSNRYSEMGEIWQEFSIRLRINVLFAGFSVLSIYNQLAVFDGYTSHEEMAIVRVTTSILVVRKR